MARLWNSLLTGGKTMLYGLAGLALTQAAIAVGNFHPSGAAGIVWSIFGAGLVMGIIKAGQRWLSYQVEKDPAVVGPLVPLSAVPTSTVPTVLAKVETIKKAG